jgi:hypothetical protein
LGRYNYRRFVRTSAKDERFFSSYSLKYSVAVEEGNYSTTQRQMELQQLLHFKELGMPIADKTIIKKAFITGKEEVLKDMEEQAQAQMQQQQAEAQKQEKMDNAKIMSMFAKAKADIAKEQDLMASASERIAKIEDLQADAEFKSSKADMEMVKTLIELEDLDLQNLRSNLELAEYIKSINQTKQPTTAISA